MGDATSRVLHTSGENHNIHILFWGEFVQIIHHLSETIQADGSPPQVIVGLQRGGLIPAVYLSHQLGVR